MNANSICNIRGSVIINSTTGQSSNATTVQYISGSFLQTQIATFPLLNTINGSYAVSLPVSILSCSPTYPPFNPGQVYMSSLLFVGGHFGILGIASGRTDIWCQGQCGQTSHLAITFINFPVLVSVFGNFIINIDHGAFNAYPLLTLYFPALTHVQGSVSVISQDACTLGGNCNLNCGAQNFLPRYMAVNLNSLASVGAALTINAATYIVIDYLVTVNGPLVLIANLNISLSSLTTVTGLMEITVRNSLNIRNLNYVGGSVTLTMINSIPAININFLPRINGFLTVTGFSALNMIALTSVFGTVTLNSISGMVNMPNLNYVGGNLFVTANSVVFNSLVTVYGTVNIIAAAQAPAMSFLSFILGSATFNVGSGELELGALASVGGTLTFTGFNTTVNLPVLTYMQAPASIVLRGSFVSVTLSNLTSISGSIDVSQVTIVNGLSFIKLAQLTGSISIVSSSINYLNCSFLQQITGSIIIKSSAIGDIIIPNLVTIGGSVTISSISQFSYFCAPVLYSIQGELRLFNISSLINISLPVLNLVGSNVAITLLPVLTSITANVLTAVAGPYMQICSNLMLASTNVSLSIRNLAAIMLPSGSCNELCYLSCLCILYGC